MSVNDSHKKRPHRSRALKPIERVPTKKLLESIKKDIERVVSEAEPADKPKKG